MSTKIDYWSKILIFVEKFDVWSKISKNLEFGQKRLRTFRLGTVRLVGRFAYTRFA